MGVGEFLLYSDSLESISKDVVLLLRDPRPKLGAMTAQPATKKHFSSPFVIASCVAMLRDFKKKPGVSANIRSGHPMSPGR